MSDFLPWKIMNMSVRDLPDLPAESEFGGLFMVFWCGDVPVGQMSIPASLLPISSSQLAAVVPSEIAKAVGNRALQDAFPAPLPVRGRRQSPPELPELTRLLQMERPLERIALDFRQLRRHRSRWWSAPETARRLFKSVCTQLAASRRSRMRSSLSTTILRHGRPWLLRPHFPGSDTYLNRVPA